jgi:CPA2 family monovalent cation:H+ antiporter-2
LIDYTHQPVFNDLIDYHLLISLGVKALVTLSVMSLAGRKLLDPIFYYVAKSSSHEAFLSIILTTVLLMSFVTQGIGLSNTLGAFLAGLLLAETKYRYQIESDIAPFRGLLLGFFFITVGFNIDLGMIVKEALTIVAMLTSLIVGKAAIITALGLAFGMSFANAQLSGLLLAQAGEFSFVALGIAQRSGLIAPKLCKLLLTTVALSMAATPMLAEAGSYISNNIEQQKGLTHYLSQDSDAEKMKSESKEFVFVAGYGRVGKMVCDMLDRMPVRYIALDSSPVKAIEARAKGLPVFYGDINRPEVLKNFDAGAARACVFTIDDMTATNKAVINVRKAYPNLPLLVRAKNNQHKKRLENMFDDIYVSLLS